VGNFGKPRLSNTISISRVETPPRSDASGTPELAMQVVDQDSILPLMGRTPPTGGSGDIGSIRSMATHPASARVPAWSWPLDDPGWTGDSVLSALRPCFEQLETWDR